MMINDTERKAQDLGEWVMVPREPTEEMIRAYLDNQEDDLANNDDNYVYNGYRAMLSAAPKTLEVTGAVGEAGSMPGTQGFTMAAFTAKDVPVGTKLYLSSAIQAAVREKLEAALNACLVEAHGNGSEQWRFGAAKCADRVRALIK